MYLYLKRKSIIITILAIFIIGISLGFILNNKVVSSVTADNLSLDD